MTTWFYCLSCKKETFFTLDILGYFCDICGHILEKGEQMIIFDGDGNVVGSTVPINDNGLPGVVDYQLGLDQLDAMHENWLVQQALLDQEIAELLGAKYPAFRVLQDEQKLLDKDYQDRKEQLRKEILSPTIIARGSTVHSRFFRVEYSKGSETVNRPALREWADTMGLRKQVENFIKAASPFIKIVTIKSE